MPEEVDPPRRHGRIDVMMRPSRGTNPHAPIHALADALPADINLLKFSWRRALFGDWDVLHLHWPESLIRASSAPKRWAKYLLFAALMARIRIRRRPAVWTVHNESPHEQGGGVEQRLLKLWDSAVSRRVFLYPSVTPPDDSAVFIPFGDYSHVADEFLTASAPLPETERILLFGLLRPYKGIEQLLDAFHELTRDDRHDASLAIMGRPTDPEYGKAIAASVADAPDVEFRGELLPYSDLVDQISRSALVVLPYRRMYNSGAALLALSCHRPILVPSSPTMEDLRAESGDHWVMTYTGEISAEVLSSALGQVAATSSARASQTALPQRSWSVVGEQYGALYRDLVRRARAGRSQKPSA